MSSYFQIFVKMKNGETIVGDRYDEDAAKKYGGNPVQKAYEDVVTLVRAVQLGEDHLSIVGGEGIHFPMSSEIARISIEKSDDL